MKLKPASAAIFVLLFSLPVQADTNYGYPTVTRYTAERDVPCYMHLPQNWRYSLNLTKMCGGVPTSPATAAGAVGAGISYSSSGAASSGICNLPSDTDSRGRRCGGRAASERAGGR